MVNGLELGHHIGHEGLTAEAWLHRHHQDHVAQLQVGEAASAGVPGFKARAGRTPSARCAPELPECPPCVRFQMDRQDGRTGLAEAIYIPDGPVNHEMDVQRQLGNPGNGLDHRHANGQIRDKDRP